MESTTSQAAQRKHKILSSAIFTVCASLSVIIATYLLGVGKVAGSLSASQHLVLTLPWLFIAMLPYCFECVYILKARLDEGAHNPVVDEPSTSLCIHCRVMQNHLEQFVWFAVCIATGATLLPTAHLHLIPILAVFFTLARFVYGFGYLRDGTVGRRFGVQMNFTVNIGLLLGVFVLLVFKLI